MSNELPPNVREWIEQTLAYAIIARGVPIDSPEQMGRVVLDEAEAIIGPTRGNRRGLQMLTRDDMVPLIERTLDRAHELRTCCAAPDKGMQL